MCSLGQSECHSGTRSFWPPPIMQPRVTQGHLMAWYEMESWLWVRDVRDDIRQVSSSVATWFYHLMVAACALQRQVCSANHPWVHNSPQKQGRLPHWLRASRGQSLCTPISLHALQLAGLQSSGPKQQFWEGRWCLTLTNFVCFCVCLLYFTIKEEKLKAKVGWNWFSIRKHFYYVKTSYIHILCFICLKES